MNFYKHYPGDYMRDTSGLTLAEHGAYRQMLDLYYSTEKPLENVPNLYRILRCFDAKEKRAVRSIISQYWALEDGGLVNLRAKAELEKASNIREKNQKNGKSGGRPAKTRPPTGLQAVPGTKTQSVIFGFDSEKQHQTPDTRHQKKITPPSQGMSDVYIQELAQWGEP